MNPYISKKQKLLTVLIMLIIGIVVFSFYIYISKNKQEPIVCDGHYTFDYNNNYPVFLDGEWKFVWNELAHEKNGQSIEHIVNVPRMWTFYEDEKGNDYPRFGTATYSLKIDGVKKEENIAFRFPTFGTSANVYANGKLIHRAGIVSKNKDLYKPKYKVEYITYTPESSHIDLDIEVSNFLYNRGGIWLPIMIGTQDSIRDYMIKKASYDYFLLGVVFIALFIGVILAVLRPKEKSIYYFISFVILFVLYNICSGDKIIVRWFNDISMNLIVRLQYFAMSLLPYVWFRYFRILDSRVYPKTLYIIMGVQSIFMSIFSCFAPIPILTFTTYYGNVLIAAYFVLCMYGSIALIMKRNKNAIVFLSCTCFVGIGGLHDVLYGNTMLHSNIEFFGAGYLISLLAIGVLIAYKSTKDMEKAKYSIMYEQAYLNAQIKPHFLFNTLNTISSYINIDSQKAMELNYNLARFLRSTIHTDNLKSVISLQKEVENTKAYVNIEQARFDNLTIEFCMDNIQGIFLPPLTLQPLIENAIKHGLREKKGDRLVIVSGENKNNCYKIAIYDNGIGISQERLQDIKRSMNIKHKNQIYENGGIGLINVNNRLSEYLNTSLKIQSEKGKNTIISFEIY